MHATTATPADGGSGNLPLNASAYRRLFSRYSSVLDMTADPFSAGRTRSAGTPRATDPVPYLSRAEPKRSGQDKSDTCHEMPICQISTMLSFSQRQRESRHVAGNALLAGLAVCSRRTAMREPSAGGHQAYEPISGTGNLSFRHQDAPR